MNKPTQPDKKSMNNTKRQKEIEKAVAEFRKKFVFAINTASGEGKRVELYNREVDKLEAFLTQKLEHLAKQKDEEFLELLKSEPIGGIENSIKTMRGEIDPIAIAIRNKVKAELRNKLQGGKV